MYAKATLIFDTGLKQTKRIIFLHVISMGLKLKKQKKTKKTKTKTNKQTKTKNKTKQNKTKQNKQTKNYAKIVSKFWKSSLTRLSQEPISRSSL